MMKGRHTTQGAKALLLAALRLHGDNISKFLDEWTMCLMNQKEPPSERMLESLFRTQLEHSRQFELELRLYHMKCPEKSYNTLYSTVMMYLEKNIKDNRARAF